MGGCRAGWGGPLASGLSGVGSARGADRACSVSSALALGRREASRVGVAIERLAALPFAVNPDPGRARTTIRVS